LPSFDRRQYTLDKAKQESFQYGFAIKYKNTGDVGDNTLLKVENFRASDLL
jgi:hypothetical protein